jgi:hypothetical protein
MNELEKIIRWKNSYRYKSVHLDKMETILIESKKITENFCKDFPGFNICPMCKGSGFRDVEHYRRDYPNLPDPSMEDCFNCDGTGMISWIDSIIRPWRFLNDKYRI